MSIEAKLANLRNNKGVMKYLKNSSWVFGEKILRMIVGLFVGVWVARYLGPEKFGLFSYAQSIVGLFTAIATLGLDAIVVKQLISTESNRAMILGTAFSLKIIAGLGVLIILFAAMLFQAVDSKTAILVFIIASATVFQSFNVIDFYFQSEVLSKFVVYCNFIGLLLSSIVKIILILNNGDIIDFAYVVLFDSFILASGYVYFYINNNQSLIKWSFNASLAKSLLKESWPLILSGVVVSLYMKIDQIMIKEMLGVQSVGQYAAAVRLSEVWYFIPVVISASLFPAILNAKKISEDMYYSRLQKLFDFMALSAILISLLIATLSSPIVSFLYGPLYNETSAVLVIHIWCSVFIFQGVVSGKWFVSEGLQKLALLRTTSGAIVNIALNLYLIPKYGIFGAAISTLISYAVANFFSYIFDRRLHNLLFMTLNALLLGSILKWLMNSIMDKIGKK
jgi:O-antigen/teichoic acid export membrane protein